MNDSDRAAIYREALEKIKRHVCGEATPRWSNDMKTTGSRLYIADLVDDALTEGRDALGKNAATSEGK